MIQDENDGMAAEWKESQKKGSRGKDKEREWREQNYGKGMEKRVTTERREKEEGEMEVRSGQGRGGWDKMKGKEKEGRK